MWNPRGNGEKLVAVAIDKDKTSQNALKWARDHVLNRGQTVTLIHVNQPQLRTTPLGNNDGTNKQDPMDLFLPFRCFCSRREVLWEAVTLEEQDIAKALIDYISFNRVDTLVLGAPSRSGISRLFKGTDIPSTVLKGAPYFCNVYVISKGKIASVRAASHPLPTSIFTPERTPFAPPRSSNVEMDSMIRATDNRLHDEFTIPETDISYISSGRMSTDSMFFTFYDNLGPGLGRGSTRSMSVGSRNFDPLGSGSKLADFGSPDHELLPTKQETRKSCSPLMNIEEVEEKMRRLEVQMKQTMDMYHAACKEALTAKQKARELQLRKMEDEKRLEEAERAKNDALMIAEKEKEKCKVALRVAEEACKKSKQEAQKRFYAEIKAFKEAEDKKMLIDSISLKYQSLLRIVVVLFVFCIYFF